MVTFYILLALSIILSTTFILAWSREKPLLSFCLKGVATISVISLAFYTLALAKIDTTLSILLISGLCFCLLGDLSLALLELCNTEIHAKIKTSGTIAFAIAQILFIVLLALLEINSLFGLIFGLVFAGLIFVLKKPLKLDFGKCLIPSIIYASLLGSNVAGAIIFMFTSSFSILSILLTLGFVFFLISDLVLSLIYYGNNTKVSIQKINLMLYYIAIICIASSFVAI